MLANEVLTRSASALHRTVADKYDPTSMRLDTAVILTGHRRLSPETSRAVAIINRRPAVAHSTGRYIFYAVYEAVDVAPAPRFINRIEYVTHRAECVDRTLRSLHSPSRIHIVSDR